MNPLKNEGHLPYVHYFCQAQPQLQPQPWLKAEIALFSCSPPTHPHQSVANIFFGTEYEYEYIRNVLFSTNTNTNIFGIIFRTEYEYIRNTTVDRIRIFEYFWLEYSNIFGSNIRIFLVWIFEYYYRQTLKYSMDR